ncbi:MAG: peptidyl-prolyl cis-trans isomerase [Pseudomonadota bacterium]
MFMTDILSLLPRFPSVSRCAFLAVALAAAGSVPAKTVDTLADPALAMTVNERAYPVRVVDMMLMAAQQSRKDATWAQMLDSLVENQLIAAQGVRDVGREALQAADKVGFTPQMVLEEQFNSLVKLYFFRQIDGYVKQRRGLDDLLVWRIPADHTGLKELTTLRDRGEVRLTPEQRKLAAATVIAGMKLPDGTPRDITFEDVYVRMNVQGRVRVIQDRDLKYLDNLVLSRVESLFVGWWAEKQSGLSAAEITALKTLLEEKQLRENYVLMLGVVSTLHEDTTPHLARLQKTVTRDEIHAWYGKNREQFRQVEKVKARHIRCATENDCNAAAAAIKNGMEFSAAAKKFSTAEDRNATPAGSLGWVLREPKQHVQELPWLHQVALIQQKGQMSPPIRSPEDARGNAVWEIVLVDERVEGYSPVDSETVAYLARQEIAKKKAVQQYTALRRQLVTEADIRRNGALLKARHTPDDDKPRAEIEAPPSRGHDHGHGHGGHGH